MPASKTFSRNVTDATVLGRLSLFDAYMIMAGCTDRWALTTVSSSGVTRVSRLAVARAHMVAAGI